jgi:HK97 gp10 family phage protein
MAFRTSRTSQASRAGTRGGVVVEGVDALVRDITRKAATIAPLAGKAVVDSAGRAAQRMRDKVPIDEGDTLGSITSDSTASPSPAGVYADAGPEHFVARFLENGTVHMSPRPFVGPAADLTVPELEQALRDLGSDL